MSAGYSGTPLARKLRVGATSRLLVVDPPPGFLVPDLPDGAVAHTRAGRGPYDVALVFTPDLAALRRRFEPVSARTTIDGITWVAWPKRSSGVSTDLTEDIVREVGLASGLVDVKVCAVDQTWSGLGFVRRLADR